MNIALINLQDSLTYNSVYKYLLSNNFINIKKAVEKNVRISYQKTVPK